FEEFYGTIHGAGSYFDPVTLCRGNHYQRETQGEFYYTEWIARRAAEMIEQAARDERPFFLYVAFTAPHWPLHAGEDTIRRYRSRYAAGWDSTRQTRFRRMKAMGIIRPNWRLSAGDPRVGDWESNRLKGWQQRRMETYAAQVDRLDRSVGTVLQKLRQVGAEENTLVMFLSDNGACAEEISPRWEGQHIPEETRDGRPIQVGNRPDFIPGSEQTYQSYGIAWANVSNTPLRLYKHYMHEGGIATPLIVRWPAVIRDGGGIVRQVGHVIDVMPTCLEVAETRYPERFQAREIHPLEGRGLVPLFEGETRPQPTLCWEHEGHRAVREGKWKLVALKGRAWELYNMDVDRTETNNLAKTYPAIVQDLAATYDAWAERCGVLPWGR
ncbi:MAG: sulfatase-like hydrolase/transferase, partial [Pirellulales bacterium]